jgi:uncharacterized protein YjiK
MRQLLWFLPVILLIASAFALKKATHIKPKESFFTEVPEPSDICNHPNNSNYFMVSDNGFLFEVDENGKIIRKADFEGFDCEGVHADENFVYVVEEMVRKIRVFDLNTLELVRTVHLPYQGGRNKGYEAITFNKAKNKMVILTEKDPIYLFELNEDLSIYNEILLDGIARDISAATYHEDHLWLLSDEDRTVFKLNPNNYKVLGAWKFPIINPEGLVFNKKGQMVIVSDDMEKFFIFETPLP